VSHRRDCDNVHSYFSTSLDHTEKRTGTVTRKDNDSGYVSLDPPYQEKFPLYVYDRQIKGPDSGSVRTKRRFSSSRFSGTDLVRRRSLLQPLGRVSNLFGRKGTRKCSQCRDWRQKVFRFVRNINIVQIQGRAVTLRDMRRTTPSMRVEDLWPQTRTSTVFARIHPEFANRTRH
jgi:hypothetical protein